MPTPLLRPARTPVHLTVRPDLPDPSRLVAALYPLDTAAAQAVLARAACHVLRDAGRDARNGLLIPHTTVEVRAGQGWVVLVPMAGLPELDSALAEEDDRDPALWHLLARGENGRLLEHADAPYGCPAVLATARGGVDPASAVPLLADAVADPLVRSLLGLGGAA